MKKVLENYGGIILFYAVVIIAALTLCSSDNTLEKPNDNSFYTAQVANN